MIITLTNFNTFMNDFETSTDVDTLKTNCISSAEGIVEGFLGYKINKTGYNQRFRNIYSDFIVVNSYITKIISLKISDVEVFAEDISFEKYYITVKNYNNYKNCVVEISYEGGWTNTTAPAIISVTVCEIATLLYLQTAKNIGVTGLLGTDGMSRTFINYTNFDKYLKKLEDYKR